MIINDRKIWSWARECVTPFDEKMINPASIDLRLGNQVRVSFSEGWSEPQQIKGSYRLWPGQLVLAHTLETVAMPDCFAGMLALKSTRARQGFEHSHAGFVDPGFKGELTLEIANVSPWELLLVPGMRIAQLVLMECMIPGQSYRFTGHYQGQTGPTVPAMWVTNE